MNLESLQRSEMVYKEFLNCMEESGKYTETELCEVMDTSAGSYQYIPYVFTQEDWVGYFILRLKDCLAFLPVSCCFPDRGGEQIDENGIRKLNLHHVDDYSMVYDSLSLMTKAERSLRDVLDLNHIALVPSDIDRHGECCECGKCNSNGKSYGISLIQIPKGKTFENEEECEDFLNNEEPEIVLYAPSEEAAKELALDVIKDKENYVLYEADFEE